jgi:hypothetical protein
MEDDECLHVVGEHQRAYPRPILGWMGGEQLVESCV